MNTIKVDNLPTFEFWLGMYKPRTKDWQRKHLAALRKGTNTFMNPNETNDKIKALKFLLNN